MCGRAAWASITCPGIGVQACLQARWSADARDGPPALNVTVADTLCCKTLVLPYDWLLRPCIEV